MVGGFATGSNKRPNTTEAEPRTLGGDEDIDETWVGLG
jgi:hypothetical protein